MKSETKACFITTRSFSCWLQIGMLVLIFVFCSSLLQARPPLTLHQCYELALEHSETIELSNEELEQNRARFLQVLGGVLPTVSLNFKEFLQDDSVNRSSVGSSISSSLVQFSRPELVLTLRQTLFQGLKDFHAYKYSKADRERIQWKLADAKRLLLRDVAMAYYAIVKLELEIQTNEKIISVIQSRVKEVKNRVSLGKSRKSELLAQEADLSLLQADLARVQGAKRVAYELLSYLTGLTPHPPIALTPPQKQLKKLDFYLAQINSRPDLKVFEKNVELADRTIKIRRGDFLPRVDADFNYYPYRGGSAFQKEVHWDASVSVGIPLLNLSHYANLREAKSKKRQAVLEQGQAHRSATYEVKKSYQSYLSTQRQIELYRVAVQKTKLSYENQLNDYHTQLITNLDVLQSQRSFLEALKNYEMVRAQNWLDWINLQITAGDLP